MQILLTILAIIIIFSILVLIHEIGHFLVAKRAKVKVLEFGLGFPPRLFAKKFGETVYSVNAIPFGGFVKLYGEDARDPDLLRSKRSFIGKSAWTRTKIIVAGVLMNFILAYVLLSSGFIFGIQPLILNESDLFNYISSGTVEVYPSIFIKDVKKGSIADKAGLLENDEVVNIDNKPVSDISVLDSIEKGNVTKDIDLTVRRGLEIKQIHLVMPNKGKNFGMRFNTAVMLPHPAIHEIDKKSIFKKSGLEKGDIILAVSGDSVYTPADIAGSLLLSSNLAMTVLRGSEIKSFQISPESSEPRVRISEVFKESNAEKSGFQKGDAIEAIDSKIISSPEEASKLIKESKSRELEYKLIRDNKPIVIKAATDAKNILGVALNQLFIPKDHGLKFYQTTALTSLTKIHNIKLPVLSAVKQGAKETIRLTELTAFAFINTFKKLFTKFEVPEEIGGPVQIAYYTHVFVQEGFFALLRFTALLSLSLAVLNILPFPALDGGRFLFVLIEVVTRRRVNPRFESAVHGIGFAILLFLILLVTYSDFAKIF